MSNLTLYQLQPLPGGGFHFGQEGLELEQSGLTFPSDSLYAALTAVIAEQEGPAAATTFTARLQTEPPFRLSSLFPYVGRLPLLPLPRLPIKTTRQALPRKFTKKTRFVSPQIFRRLCAGEPMDDYLAAAVGGKDARFLQDGAIWLTQAEQAYLPGKWPGFAPDLLAQQKVWQAGSVPRVTIDRVTNASSIYQSGRVSFNDGCGLWLAVAYADPDAQTWLELRLAHLGDRGIGGERTNGYGAFRCHYQPDFVAAWPTAGDGRVLLSRFLPQAAEVAILQRPSASYQLAAVGGWAYFQGFRPLRRQRVTMLVEGSVLPTETLAGQTVDVTPAWDKPLPHSVYRCGLALSLPAVLSA